MNKVLISLVLGSFVLVGTSFAQTPTPTAAPAAPDATTPAASAPAAAAPVKAKHTKTHDALHKALHELKLAKDNLAKVTTADAAGHRAKAVSDIEDAISELKAS